MSVAADVISALKRAGASVCTAESLTGGLICAALIDVPGASECVLGGIVAYDPGSKSTVLGVDPNLIESAGTVDAGTAASMARMARMKFAATYGLSATGVAGPEPSEGHRPGTVFVAIASESDSRVTELSLAGDRPAIRSETVVRALSLLLARLGDETNR